MVYRNRHPDPERESRERAKRKLAELEIPEAEKLLRANETRIRQADEKTAQSENWLLRLLDLEPSLEVETVVGRWAGARINFLIALIPVGVPVLGSILPAAGLGVLGVLGVFGVLGVLGGLLFWAYPSHLVAKEERWLTRLPFSVAGYWEALGYQRGPERSVSVCVVVSSNTEAPDQSLLEKLLSRIGAKVIFEKDARRLLIESPRLPCGVTHSTNSDGPVTHNEPGNREVRAWLRLLLARVLPEVAKVYPIVSVEIVDD